MADRLTTTFDPVEGLVNYTLFTKPYHTKILEVLVEYIHTDCVDVTIQEGFFLSLGMPDPSLLPLWGFSLEEAQAYFNCDFQSYQVCEVNPSVGYFDIVGDYAANFQAGDTILLQTDQLQFTEFTIDTVTSSATSLTTVFTKAQPYPYTADPAPSNLTLQGNAMPPPSERTGSPLPDMESFEDADCNTVCGSSSTSRLPSTTGSPPVVGSPACVGSPPGQPREGRVISCRDDFRFTGSNEKTRITVTETIQALSPVVVAAVGNVVRNVGGSPVFTDGSPPVQVQYFWAVDGQTTVFQAGDTLEAFNDSGIADASYVVLSVDYDNEEMQTRIFVAEDLSTANADGSLRPLINRTAGVIFPSSCYTFDSERGVYNFKGGIVWPSLSYVESNINCGGWGTIWDSQGTGSPQLLDISVLNPVTGGVGDLGYFEIDNTAGLPASISGWDDAFKYGIKFQIVGSTGNDSEYTVLTSHLVFTGSPLAATNTLRIYVNGNVASNTMDGSIQIIPWGYDEPVNCVEDGQSQTAFTGISEEMLITLNENGTNIVAGWDMEFFDTAGYDSGSFTYTVAFT